MKFLIAAFALSAVVVAQSPQKYIPGYGDYFIDDVQVNGACEANTLSSFGIYNNSFTNLVNNCRVKIRNPTDLGLILGFSDCFPVDTKLFFNRTSDGYYFHPELTPAISSTYMSTSMMMATTTSIPMSSNAVNTSTVSTPATGSTTSTYMGMSAATTSTYMGMSAATTTTYSDMSAATTTTYSDMSAATTTTDMSAATTTTIYMEPFSADLFDISMYTETSFEAVLDPWAQYYFYLNMTVGSCDVRLFLVYLPYPGPFNYTIDYTGDCQYQMPPSDVLPGTDGTPFGYSQRLEQLALYTNCTDMSAYSVDEEVSPSNAPIIPLTPGQPLPSGSPNNGNNGASMSGAYSMSAMTSGMVMPTGTSNATRSSNATASATASSSVVPTSDSSASTYVPSFFAFLFGLLAF